jgi:hypothetical protein
MRIVRSVSIVVAALVIAGCEVGAAPSTGVGQAPPTIPVAPATSAPSPLPTQTPVPTFTPAARTPRPTAPPLPAPAKPTGIRVHEVMEEICDPEDPVALCGIGDSTFTLSWKAPQSRGVTIRVYGVKRCYGADDHGRMIDGWCLRERTALPASARVLLATAPASAGKVEFRVAQDEHWFATVDGTQVYAFVLAAFNADGVHSVFAIAARGMYCSVADVACPGDVEWGEFEPGSWMATIVDGVRVRSKPAVSAASRKYAPLLPKGTEFEILRGPVEASGYRWYEVRLASGILQDGVTRGWLADGSKDGEQWIEPRGIDEG